MTDLDSTVRDALDAAGARVRTAPPFAGVRRRHTRRRARQAATTAAALGAVVAGVAVAVPDGGRAPGPSLATQGPSVEESAADAETMAKIHRCIDAYPTAKPAPMMDWPVWVSRDDVEACYTMYGVSPPPAANPWASDDPRADGTYRCDPAPGATEAAVASGRAEGVPWKVVVWEGRDGTWCSSWRTDQPPNTQLMHFDSVDDFGRVGSVRAELSWTPLEDTKADRSDVVVWGAVRPEVAKVRIVTVNGTHEVETVSLPAHPDRRWVGALVPNVGEAGWHAELLDASGAKVGRWPALP